MPPAVVAKTPASAHEKDGLPRKGSGPEGHPLLIPDYCPRHQTPPLSGSGIPKRSARSTMLASGVSSKPVAVLLARNGSSLFTLRSRQNSLTKGDWEPNHHGGQRAQFIGSLTISRRRVSVMQMFRLSVQR